MEEEVASIERSVNTDATMEEGGASVEKSTSADATASKPDSNLVNWNGPDDPENPRNWSHGYKMLNVLLVGLSILCT